MPDPHLALAVLAVLVLVVLARHARGPAHEAVAGTLTMLALGASWALPGYMAWGMPAAALDHRSRLARISAAGGLVLLLTYDVLRHPLPGDQLAVRAAVVYGPLLMVALIIGLLTTRTSTPARSHVMIDLSRRPDPVLSPSFGAGALVIIPTLDEAPNIKTVLQRVRKAVPAAHVLVVDDGSDDGTPEIVESLAAASDGLVHLTRRTGPVGLGPAYQYGFRYGLVEGYDVLIEMDADLSHDPADLPFLIEAVQQGADLAIGRATSPAVGPSAGRRAGRRFRASAGGTPVVSSAPRSVTSRRATARTAPTCCGRSTSSRSARRATGSRSR